VIKKKIANMNAAVHHVPPELTLVRFLLYEFWCYNLGIPAVIEIISGIPKIPTVLSLLIISV